MFFETIQSLYEVSLKFSPFIAIPLFLGSLFVHRLYTLPSLAVAFVIGLVGCVVIQPIEPGAWGWGVIGYIFIFSWWFIVGYLFGWSIFSLFVKPRRLISIGLPTAMAGVLLGLFLLKTNYCEKMEHKIWGITKNYLDGEMSETEFKETSFHKTRGFKKSADRYLGQKGDELTEEKLLFLSNCGFNVLSYGNCPRKLIDKTLSYIGTKRVTELFAKERLYALASKPNLEKDDFTQLADLGDDQVFQRLISNPSTDLERLEILNIKILKLLQQVSDDERLAYQKNRYSDNLEHLKRRRIAISRSTE